MKIKIGLIVISFLFLSGMAHADKIYLQSDPKGNEGKVLEEYPDSIVIKFPKSEIKRIEAGEKPPLNQEPAQKVIWIDDGDTVTLKLPKQSVQFSGTETTESPKGVVTETAGGKPHPAPPFSAQALSGQLQDRVIQGKVFMKGEPLANCKIRILMISDPGRDRLLKLFSGSETGKEEQSFEAVSDEHGVYTFTNVPYGEYILYWKPEGSEHWIRRMSENPDIALVPGRPVSVRNIETNIRTVN